MQCVFHFNARFDQNQTVRNTNFPSSSWGHEERSALPFSRNRHFFMEIRCLPDRFLVRFLPQITCRVALAALAYTYNVTYTGSYLFFACSKYLLSIFYFILLKQYCCFVYCRLCLFRVSFVQVLCKLDLWAATGTWRYCISIDRSL